MVSFNQDLHRGFLIVKFFVTITKVKRRFKLLVARFEMEVTYDIKELT